MFLTGSEISAGESSVVYAWSKIAWINVFYERHTKWSSA